MGEKAKKTKNEKEADDVSERGPHKAGKQTDKPTKVEKGGSTDKE